jgi:hypothetical protein
VTPPPGQARRRTANVVELEQRASLTARSLAIGCWPPAAGEARRLAGPAARIPCALSPRAAEWRARPPQNDVFAGAATLLQTLSSGSPRALPLLFAAQSEREVADA